MFDQMRCYDNTQTYYSFWNKNLADDFLPYGEVCTHVYSGLHLFSFDADLFETTFYVTTRLQKDRYGRLIDLEHVNPTVVRCCSFKPDSL